MSNSLLKANAQLDQILYDSLYGRLVEIEIRKTQSQRDVEAILNNYLAEPENEKYVNDFKKLQEHRKLAKETAKAILDS